MTELGIFVFSYLFFYLIYLFLIILKNKKYDYSKIQIEVLYLIKKFNIDVEKIGYRKLLNILGLVLSLNIAISITIVSYIDNTILQIILGLLLLLPLSIITFNYVGNYFVKKGMVKK